MIDTEWRVAPSAAELAEVRALIEAVAVADGTAAWSESVSLDLTGVAGRLGAAADAPVTTRHLLVRDGDQLVAYAHVDETVPDDTVVELGVHPRHRRGGVGTATADLLAGEWPGARAWAHGDHPGAARLAARLGMRRDRELWQMRRGPEAGPLPVQPPRDDVEIGPLRVGEDEQTVVAVNNRAFAWHPEQGRWSVEEVVLREKEPWFDAAGVLLARDAQDDPGTLLGFHWTKVHERSASVPEALGEVYVVGVDPAARGRGLGSALTLAGLHHLARRGFDTVILYVEGDNAAAIATYRRLGFERVAVDVSYRGRRRDSASSDRDTAAEE